MKTYTCTKCGEKKTEAVAKISDHTWDAGVVSTAATCESDGVITHTCTVCGETKTETIAKIEHSWDAGVVTVPATTTSEGVKTFTCTACGTTKTEPIPVNEEPYDVKFLLDPGSAKVGEAFVVTLSVKSAETAEVDGLLAYDLQYDGNVLEFLGMASYGTLVTSSIAGADSVVGNNIITLGYTPSIIANGKICELNFRVKNTVSAGTQTTVSMKATAAKDRRPLNIVIEPSCVITVN